MCYERPPQSPYDRGIKGVSKKINLLKCRRVRELRHGMACMRHMRATCFFGKYGISRVRAASLCFPLTLPLESPTQGNGNKRHTKGKSMVMPAGSRNGSSLYNSIYRKE